MLIFMLSAVISVFADTHGAHGGLSYNMSKTKSHTIESDADHDDDEITIKSEEENGASHNSRKPYAIHATPHQHAPSLIAALNNKLGSKGYEEEHEITIEDEDDDERSHSHAPATPIKPVHSTNLSLRSDSTSQKSSKSDSERNEDDQVDQTSTVPTSASSTDAHHEVDEDHENPSEHGELSAEIDSNRVDKQMDHVSQIIHQQNEFAKLLQETVSALTLISIEGISGASQIQLLRTYIELARRSSLHVEELTHIEQTTYSMLSAVTSAIQSTVIDSMYPKPETLIGNADDDDHPKKSTKNTSTKNSSTKNTKNIKNTKTTNVTKITNVNVDLKALFKTKNENHAHENNHYSQSSYNHQPTYQSDSAYYHQPLTAAYYPTATYSTGCTTCATYR